MKKWARKIQSTIILYVKSVQIWSFIWSVFSRIRTEYLSVFSPNVGKYGPEKTPYLGTFHVVYDNKILHKSMIKKGSISKN